MEQEVVVQTEAQRQAELHDELLPKSELVGARIQKRAVALSKNVVHSRNGMNEFEMVLEYRVKP